MGRFAPALTTLTVLLAVAHPAAAPAQDAAGASSQAAPRTRPLPSIAERTAGFQRLDGFFPLYWDDPAGTLTSRSRA